MMAHAAMARSNLDAFSMGASILDAALPCHDTVASAEDGCRGYGRRVVKVGRHLSILDRAIRKRVVELSRVCRLGVALEGASQRDHQPYVVDSQFREFACVNAAQAPADQAHFAAGRADRATPGDARAGLLLVPAAIRDCDRGSSHAPDSPGRAKRCVTALSRHRSRRTPEGSSPDGRHRTERCDGAGDKSPARPRTRRPRASRPKATGAKADRRPLIAQSYVPPIMPPAGSRRGNINQARRFTYLGSNKLKLS